MGLFNFLKKGNNAIQPESSQSKYEHLPLVNIEEDKNSPKGYVERKFITEEKLYQNCENIFSTSNIPIVSQCDKAIKYIGTIVLRNKNGSKVRSVQEIVYFSVPESLQNKYLELVNPLNDIIKRHEIPSQYLIKLHDIKFISRDRYSKMPLSYIKYEQDLKEFNFIYAIENELPPTCEEFAKYSSPVYNSLQIGSITYDENGIMKKAHFVQGGIDKFRAKIRFKNYKAGFELYDIAHNGNIIYKRNCK